MGLRARVRKLLPAGLGGGAFVGRAEDGGGISTRETEGVLFFGGGMKIPTRVTLGQGEGEGEGAGMKIPTRVTEGVRREGGMKISTRVTWGGRVAWSDEGAGMQIPTRVTWGGACKEGVWRGER